MFIRSMHMSNPEGSDQVVTLACTMDESTTVAEKMDWGLVTRQCPTCPASKPNEKCKICGGTGMERISGDIDGGITKAGLKGKLLATLLDMTPDDRGLKKFKLFLPIDTVRNFELVAIRNKEGDITHREIRFYIDSSSPDAAEKVALYCRRLKRSASVGKVSYSIQLKLGDEEGQEDAEQPELEELG